MMTKDPIHAKLSEARFHLKRLEHVEKMKEFYPTVNAFLSAARSVLYVAAHELGWRQRLATHRTGFTSNQVAERKRFDAWFDSSPEAKAVLDHPLSEERQIVIHRGGQAGFYYIPRPLGGLGGMEITKGTAYEPSLVLRKRRISLPLEDVNTFHYEDATSTKHDAFAYCNNYLQLVESFVHAVDQSPWR